MRITHAIVLFVFLGIATTVPMTQLSAQESAATRAKISKLQQGLLGAWEITGSPGNTNEPEVDAELKFWGLSHFAVTKRNATTGDIDYHHMGTYTLDGDQYVETVTFAIGDTEQLIGKSFTFRIEVDGDTYIQHGVGNPYTQQWKRLRPVGAPKATPEPAVDETDKLLEVPAEASNTELLTFMDRARRMTPTQRDAAGVRLHAQKVFGAILKAADIVIARGESEDDLVSAITKKFDALTILVNYDPTVEPQLAQLIEQYCEDERPAIAMVAVGQSLRSKSKDLRNATPDTAQAISDEVVAFLDRFGASKATYAPIASVASAIGYSDQKEIAAELHEKLAPYFLNAEDDSLHRYAGRMQGTARRLRLLDHEMELTGTMADGSAFDWADYRGKVVLVDFWASWCGPCISEIPNMKKNLERYAVKGFTIVGINMDSTRAPFEKSIEQHDISWANIVSEEEGHTGWDAPMAVHYGVSGIPTAILVDQQGKVVSLNARGRELDKQLVALLGEPADEKDSVEKPDDKDDDKDDE